MDFVILDLEWNTAYSKTAHGFVNEIIEFGAVKTDSDLNEIASFERLITPQIGKKLSGRVKQLTHLTNEDLAGGGDFLSVAQAFESFAGDSVVMTWGTSDIHTLIENFRYFTGSERIPFLKAYCDLQEYCERAIDRFDEGCQIGLGNFADIIGVTFSEEEQHRAAADAYLSLKCLKKVFGGYPLEKCVLKADCDEFYERMLFKNHFLTDLSDPEIDRKQMKFDCERCGKPMRRVKKWRLRNKSFTADFCCKSCGKSFTGKVSFKKRFDGVVVNKRLAVKEAKQTENRQEQES